VTVVADAGPDREGGGREPDLDPSTREAPVARHLLPLTSERDAAGRMSVGGVDLLDLADEVGTPAFVYDEEHLRSRCREAVSAFGPGVAYATKAFLCKAMAALAHEEGLALDVSTAGELAVALAAGVPAGQLVMHGNNKSVPELEEALARRVGRIVVDSFDEIDRLEGLVGGGRPPQPVMVRVTPGVEAHTHEYLLTGQEDTKFGFGLESGAAHEAVARLRAMPGLDVVGVHAHIGSQIFRVDSFAREVTALAPFVAELGVKELCVGGGLGVAYLNSERAPSIVDWATALRANCVAAGLPPDVHVSAEPGRSIAATAGITLYRVGTVKELPGIRRYVSVDGGMSDNPRPVLYGSGYEAFLPRDAGARRPLVAKLVGKHCESGDIVVEEAHLPADLHVGDVLATPVTGAYGHSMASNYNRVGRPPVVFLRDGRARVVVRRETIEDLLALEP
jgi:diaminopimelate decarboxylase